MAVIKGSIAGRVFIATFPDLHEIRVKGKRWHFRYDWGQWLPPSFVRVRDGEDIQLEHVPQAVWNEWGAWYQREAYKR